MKLQRAWLKPESLELKSRNPRSSRQSKTVSGKLLIGATRAPEEMREALGLTQAELAKALGVRRTMIANIEAGRYAAFILVGIKTYLFFAKIAAEKQLTPLYVEAKRDVARFIAFQRGLNVQAIRKAERGAEDERKRRAILEKQLADEEARLREL